MCQFWGRGINDQHGQHFTVRVNRQSSLADPVRPHYLRAKHGVAPIMYGNVH